MIKVLYIMSLLLFSTIALGQDADSTVHFYDEYGEKTIIADEAYTYSIVIPRGELTFIRHFYAANDQPVMEGTFIRRGITLEHDGPYKSWYPNGQLEIEGSYTKNRKVGLWKMYYATGQQADQQFIDADKIKYHQHWDEDGTPKIINGNGKFTAGEQHLEVIDSMLFSAFTIDSLSGDSLYIVVPEQASYNGGMDKFYDDIERDLKYPKLARQYFIEGTVYIEFIVDKSGKLHHARVKKGIGGGCDEAALKAMEKRTSWSPAKLRGKPVIQQMVLPIAFNLK